MTNVDNNLVGKESSPDEIPTTEEDEEFRLAIEEKLTNQDIAFAINTMKKEAPHDGISIRQLFYGMASTFSKNPIPHNVNSKDPGAGKSYLLNLVASYFPEKYVIALAGMSDKAILHRNGIMVIKKKDNGTGEDEVEPIVPILCELELQKEELEEQIEKEKAKKAPDKDQIKQDKKRIKEIEAEIKDIQNHAEKLIDLNNQIILYLLS